MTKIVVDAATRGKLGNLDGSLEFTDELGRVLGHFTPAPRDLRREPQISEEEIDRRLRQGGGRPLADILADLQKRA